MWKRVWKRLWLLGFSLLFLAGAPPGAQAALVFCGSGPVLPPDGFAWPATGAVSKPWSLDCLSGKGHRGIDIDAPAGAKIRAAAGGTVVFAGYTPAEGGGGSISISHPGGVRSTYLHIQGALVAAGDKVSQGDVIATSAGPFVHFGLKSAGGDDLYYDPLPLLGTAAPKPEAPGTPTVKPASGTQPAANPAPAAASASPAPAASPAPVAAPAPANVPAAAHPVTAQPAAAPPLSNRALELSAPAAPASSPAAGTAVSIASPGRGRAAGPVGLAQTREIIRDRHSWPFRLTAAIAAAGILALTGVGAAATVRRKEDLGPALAAASF